MGWVQRFDAWPSAHNISLWDELEHGYNLRRLQRLSLCERVSSVQRALQDIFGALDVSSQVARASNRWESFLAGHGRVPLGLPASRLSASRPTVLAAAGDEGHAGHAAGGDRGH